MRQKNITEERLKQLLTYSPGTGVFTNKISRSRGLAAGRENRVLDRDGYVIVSIDGYPYKAHQLAVLYMTGEMPKRCIDHINGKRNDNRWGNLREATWAMNSQNMRAARCDSGTGVLGVSFDKCRGKYLAQILANGRKRNLGRYATVEEAQAAYLSAKREFHEGVTI